MQRIVAIVLLSAVCLAAARPLLAEQEYEAMFTAFVREHGKYYDAQETAVRYNTFKANLDYVMKHNVAAEAGKYTYTLAMNKFGDWTNEEYRKTMLGLKRKGASKNHKDNLAMGTITAQDGNPPATWDWRKLNAVNDVKDQGQCGSCWAFSATAALEFGYLNKSNTLLSLSEQLCVDCTMGGNYTCDTGGEMHDCYLEVKQLGADETEDNYPYTAVSSGVCQFNQSLAAPVHVAGYVNCTMGDENALKVMVYKAVTSIAIDASSMDFQLYSGGVYNEPDCQNGWNELDHGVAIVGYDNDATGGDYWIVRNSWGDSWGLNGYVWMSRNKNNQCGVATDSTIPIMMP